MSITAPGQSDQTLNAAIAAIRAGETKRGRALLAQVLRANPSCESAWLWMATVVETPQQKRECLERALAINPYNSIARRELESSGGAAPPVAPVQMPRTPDPAADAPPLPASAAHCPNCGAEIDTTNQRCDFCGSLLPVPASTSPSTARKREPLSEQERLRLTGRPGSGFVIFFHLLIFLVGCIMAIVIMLMKEHLPTEIIPILPIIILAAIFILINRIFPSRLFSDETRLTNGYLTEAQIIDIWTEEGEDVTFYYVAWEFTIPDQKGDLAHFRKAQRINRERYSLLEARDTVLVRYLPHKPQYSELDEQWLSELK